MTEKHRLLIVQPNMQPPGGAQSISVWATMALQDDYALDIFTWTPLDVQEVNRFFGTEVDVTKIRNIRVPKWLRTLFSKDPDPWSFQPLALMSRVVKIIRGRYDAVLSFCDEVDFGAPAIQYIHFPHLGLVYKQQAALARVGSWQLLRLKLRPWRLLSGFSFERMVQNVSLVNSDWTGRRFAETYGAPWHVLYPPVTGSFPRVSWAERANGFVCIGRFADEKRHKDIVEILGQVRARGHAVRLYIIGASMKRAVDREYYTFLRKLVESECGWVTLHENLSRAELEQLVAGQRYGIHAMHDEHFGIAPAELVRAGCVVFVFNNGGQVEIVGNNYRLRYDSKSDAVEKICGVLEDEHAQTELRAALAGRSELFTPERFMAGIRKVVDETIARRN